MYSKNYCTFAVNYSYKYIFNMQGALIKQLLYLVASGYININGAFEVQSGGQLNVQITPPSQPGFDYTYDASGNRISRTFVP